MKIIVLAAGKGERLMPLTRNTPKSLLHMENGHTLLEEQLKRMGESGVIDEVILVVGYLGGQIEAKVETLVLDGIKVKVLFNPFYNVSNNLLTLWLARHEMDEDFLVMNGDNLFAADVFSGLVSGTGDGVFLSVSTKDEYDGEDMKVVLRGGLVARVSKLIPNEDGEAESPGLILVRGRHSRAVFRDHLGTLAKDGEYLNRFWLEVFNSMYEGGVAVHPWEFDGNTKWQEIDFHVDLERARRLLHVSL